MNYPFIFVVNFRQQIISVSEDGPVEGAADTFKGVQKADDYHSEMNSAHNENWIISIFSKIYFCCY